MKKLAIIGASCFQESLISKAKDMGLETHVFAWAANDVGEKIADYFYPISITDKTLILEKCREIGIDGICTIASDLATITVSYVAEHMGLAGNCIETSFVSTNKHEMRKCLKKNNDPCPESRMITFANELNINDLKYPLIIKPVDRSGSRGIYKVQKVEELNKAIEKAKEQSFQKKILVEEYVEGKEYSVEYISFKGKHVFLAMTEKYTSGAPHFIETGHIEPSEIDENQIKQVKKVVEHALNSLGITIGASHTELKIDDEGSIKIIEIGARMGGDFIGSHLVPLSTGYDFVEFVIKCALGEQPIFRYQKTTKVAAVKFAFNDTDCNYIEEFTDKYAEKTIKYEITRKGRETVTDSSSRWGYCIAVFDSRKEAKTLLGLK